MTLRTSTTYKYPSGKFRLFYSCSRFPLCMTTHNAQPCGHPVGIPATREVAGLRAKCYDELHRFSQAAGLDRRQAQVLTARLVGVKKSQARLGCLDKRCCLLLLQKLSEIDPQSINPESYK